MRFGLGEIQPEQDKTNAERITAELNDLLGISGILVGLGLIPKVDKSKMNEKRLKIERFLLHSAENGRLD
mgnify:CR=1 FL=1